MHFEAAVLATTACEVDIRKQRVRLVQNTVGREVQDATCGRVAAEGILARLTADEDAGPRSR